MADEKWISVGVLNLEGIKAARDAALREFKQNLSALQSSCPHKNIAHYAGFESYGTYHPRRICLDCGYEEEGSWWSYSLPSICGFTDGPRMYDGWNTKEFGDPALRWKEGRNITEVKGDDFYRLRP